MNTPMRLIVDQIYGNAEVGARIRKHLRVSVVRAVNSPEIFEQYIIARQAGKLVLHS